MRHLPGAAGAVACAALILLARPLALSAQLSTQTVTHAEVGRVLDALPETLPAGLKARLSAGDPAAWPQWVAEHRTSVRARLDRGDEDSIVNLWLYGTTFTDLPPSRDGTNSVEARLDHFIAALASPGDNERLAFARDVFARRGIDVASRGGAAAARRLLTEAHTRALAEFSLTDQALRSAARTSNPADPLAVQSTIFQDRGLSSDTSILVDFAIERTLDTLKAAGTLGAGTVRRVAIVGPGLDFINKADGYDFYPPQTIQPFAVIDSLLRLGLAAPGDLRLTTLDVSPRVNHHLNAALARADMGTPYTLHLPLSRDERWRPDLVAFWRQLGDRLGEHAQPASGAKPGDVDVRAIRVRPEVVRSIVPRELDIVVERLPLAANDARFDLVVATNVFVYYDRFEQALAVANVASMLRPGGILLSNNDVVPLPPMGPAAGYLEVAYSDRQGDRIFAYQRQ